MLPLRAGAVLALLGTGAVHLYLYTSDGYRYIPKIGVLFVATVITAGVLAIAFALRPHWTIALLGAGFAASTLGGYLLSLGLSKGIFQFHETSISASGAFSIAFEVTATLLLLGWAEAHRPTRHRA